ncbi:exosome protein [Candidatus Bathyarchaeota archaeon]|nr:exosome protein [Candidatus Bathyarchaeota archaeon]MBS7613817.1 exosome protein [Candidatus Bathyarchaeota archaeon]MBS7617984.1 exosome protein [Candidatus Bathyarchaeota archaeon]
MPKTPKDLVEVEAYAHATEDSSKVEEAVRNILLESVRDKFKLEKAALRGHYGNPIIVYRGSIENVSEEFLLSLIRRMSSEDKASLKTSLDMHLGKHNILYLRFNKQEAYLGRLKLDQIDAICLRLKFKPHVFDRLPKLIESKEG